MIAGFKELGKQKWAPEVYIAGSDGGAGGSSQAFNSFMQMITTKTAKDLALDLKMKSKSTQ
jgi:hypothetical protein